MRKHRFRVFGNMVLRKIFVPRRDEVKEAGENWMVSVLMYTVHPILLR